MAYNCIRCGAVLEDPERSAIYVSHPEMAVEIEEDLTDLDIRERGLSESDLEERGVRFVVRGEVGEIPAAEFAGSVDAIRRATVRTQVQKTGLVCQDCYRPGEDLRIWGTTREEDAEAERQAALARLEEIESELLDRKG